MKQFMEHQLSWLALVVTTFYSLLASCRGEKCGPEELVGCARPLQRIKNNDLTFVENKQDLQQICPDFEAGINCIRNYTIGCMKAKQREHFNSMYAATNKVIKEICQDGPYQDEFLRHAPCMQKVKDEYELCYQRYQRTTQEIERRNHTGGTQKSIKSVCCVFKEYLECSQHAVRRKCGEETAQFTKEFLDRMSNSLLKVSCSAYSYNECRMDSAGSTARTSVSVLMALLFMVVLGRYFT